MKLYTRQQANNILIFYADKCKGRQLEQSTQTIIDHLEIRPTGDNLFRVVAVSNFIHGGSTLHLDIDKVAERLNLVLVDDFLKHPNQNL